MGIKLSEHKHSGAVLAHHHTSYAALLFLLMLTGALLLAVAWEVRADSVDGGGDYGVYATVAAKLPDKAPVITNPSSGREFGEAPVTISGTCQDGTIIKVSRNNIVGAATQCINGSFSVPLALFYGSNSIIATPYNANEQPGPDSAAIGATFAPPGVPANQLVQAFSDTAKIANQLFLRTPVFHQAALPKQEVVWPIEIVGGITPYAVSVSWGDGKTDLYSRTAGGKFEMRHTYGDANQSGSYPVVVKATDASGATAYLQMLGTGKNQGAKAAAVGSSLSIAWPLLGVAAVMVVSFLLGEWREKRVLVPKQKVAA